MFDYPFDYNCGFQAALDQASFDPRAAQGWRDGWYDGGQWIMKPEPEGYVPKLMW